jgi:hypothetical protein
MQVKDEISTLLLLLLLAVVIKLVARSLAHGQKQV